MSFFRRLFTNGNPPPAPAPAPAPVPTVDPHAGLPVLDPEIQGELATVGGAELPKQLLDMFVGDAPNQIAGIRSSMAANDAEGVRKNAHSMKGAAASIGASRVEATARELEMAAREGELARLPELAERVSKALDELKAQAG